MDSPNFNPFDMDEYLNQLDDNELYCPNSNFFVNSPVNYGYGNFVNAANNSNSSFNGDHDSISHDLPRLSVSPVYSSLFTDSTNYNNHHHPIIQQNMHLQPQYQSPQIIPNNNMMMILPLNTTNATIYDNNSQQIQSISTPFISFANNINNNNNSLPPSLNFNWIPLNPLVAKNKRSIDIEIAHDDTLQLPPIKKRKINIKRDEKQKNLKKESKVKDGDETQHDEEDHDLNLASIMSENNNSKSSTLPPPLINSNTKPTLIKKKRGRGRPRKIKKVEKLKEISIKTKIFRNVSPVEIKRFCGENMSKKVVNKKLNELRALLASNVSDNIHSCHINQCGKKFKANTHLLRHVKEIHIGRRFVCKYSTCTKGFKQLSQLREHIKLKHLSVAKSFHCPACNDKFTRFHGVKRHLKLNRCSNKKLSKIYKKMTKYQSKDKIKK